MPTYIYVCTEGCGGHVEVWARQPTTETCPECLAPMRRNYPAEGANIARENLRNH